MILKVCQKLYRYHRFEKPSVILCLSKNGAFKTLYYCRKEFWILLEMTALNLWHFWSQTPALFTLRKLILLLLLCNHTNTSHPPPRPARLQHVVSRHFLLLSSNYQLTRVPSFAKGQITAANYLNVEAGGGCWWWLEWGGVEGIERGVVWVLVLLMEEDGTWVVICRLNKFYSILTSPPTK